MTLAVLAAVINYIDRALGRPFPEGGLFYRILSDSLPTPPRPVAAT
jgi:hypothetical protein